MKKLVAYGIAKKGQPFKITTLSDKEKLNAIRALLPENLTMNLLKTQWKSTWQKAVK